MASGVAMADPEGIEFDINLQPVPGNGPPE